MTVTSSTISGNSAKDDEGGGIWASGNVSITSSTISGNSASFGYGGGVRAADDLLIENSIVAGNSGDGTAPDIRPGTGVVVVA